MRTLETTPAAVLEPWRLFAFWWQLAGEMSQAFWTHRASDGPVHPAGAGRLLPFRRLADAHAVPPTPPHVPEPASPPMPHPMPDPIPPEIDDPPPVEMPAPVHEPPVMPTPMALSVIWLPDAGAAEHNPSGRISGEAA